MEDNAKLATAKAEAQKGLAKLLEALTRVGLQVTVRNGGKCSLLVFVKAPELEHFKNEVYKQR